MKNCCGDVKTILQKIAMFFIDNTVRKLKTLKLAGPILEN